MSVHLARAQQLMEWGRYELATDSLRGALAENPDDGVAHAMLAACYLKSGRLRSALDEVRTSLGLAPDFAYAHFVHGMVLSEKGAKDEAIAAVLEAIRLEPESAEHHFFHGVLLHNQRRFGESLTAVLTARRADPRHAGAANLHVLLLAQAGKMQEAEEVIDSILAVDTEFAWSHRNRALISSRRGDYTQAVASYREALRLNPMDGAARSGLVAALKRRNVVYRFSVWFFAADPGLLAGHALMRGILTSFIALLIPGLVLAWNRDPEALFPFWPLMVLSGVVLFMPIQLALRVLFLWLGDDAITVVLCFDSLGRRALTDVERRAAQVSIGCVASAVLFFAVAIAYRSVLFGIAAAIVVLGAVSVPFVLRHPAGPRRNNAVSFFVLISVSGIIWGTLRYFLNWEYAELLSLGYIWLCYAQYRSFDQTLRRRQAELSAANENQ